MADLRDPQSYNLWDKERWSKSARMATADSAAENEFKREAELRKQLQELVNSGALARLTEGAKLEEAAKVNAEERAFKNEERTFDRDLQRKGRAFGLLPRVLAGEELSAEDTAILAENAPGFNRLNTARSAIAGSPRAMDFGRRMMDQDIANAEAGTGEARVRREAATTALPMVADKTISDFNRMISGSRLSDANDRMQLNFLEDDRKRKVKLEEAQIGALLSTAARNNKQAGTGGAGGFLDDLGDAAVKPRPPGRFLKREWNDETSNISPGR